MPITADIRWSWGSVTCFGAQTTLRTVRSGAWCSTWTAALSGSPIWRRSEAGSETARATTSFKACRDRSASAARRSAMNWSRSNMGVLSIDDQLGIGEDAMPWQLASADLGPGPSPDTPGRRSGTTRRDRDCPADDVLVAPAFGEAARALERRAAAVPVHQVHRLARAVAGVDGGQPAAGVVSPPVATVAQSSAISRCAIGAPGVQYRVGPPDGVLWQSKTIPRWPDRQRV